jgi:hypothetical protein
VISRESFERGFDPNGTTQPILVTFTHGELSKTADIAQARLRTARDNTMGGVVIECVLNQNPPSQPQPSSPEEGRAMYTTLKQPLDTAMQAEAVNRAASTTCSSLERIQCYQQAVNMPAPHTPIDKAFDEQCEQLAILLPKLPTFDSFSTARTLPQDSAQTAGIIKTLCNDAKPFLRHLYMHVSKGMIWHNEIKTIHFYIKRGLTI